MPATYDLVYSVIALAYVVLLFIALRAWFHTAPRTLIGIVQVLVIVLVPVIGAAAYLAGRPKPHHQPSEVAPARPAHTG